MYDSDLNTAPCSQEHKGWTCIRPTGHEGYHMGRKGNEVMSWNDHGFSFASRYGSESRAARRPDASCHTRAGR